MSLHHEILPLSHAASGATLFMMLTLEHPFATDPPTLTIKEQKEQKFRENSTYRKKSRAARRLLKSLMNFEVDQRMTLTDALNHEWAKRHKNPPEYMSKLAKEYGARDRKSVV